MKRAQVLVAVAIGCVVIAACGRRHEPASTELRIERLTDTTGLSQGRPLLEKIEPYREKNGTLRVRGQVSFPDGVRLQISIYAQDTKTMVSRTQVVVQNHRFESPPIMGDAGPLPHGAYRFEYLSFFNNAWQSPEILSLTHDGRDLRGPGITRDPVGGASFYIVEERTL